MRSRKARMQRYYREAIRAVNRFGSVAQARAARCRWKTASLLPLGGRTATLSCARTPRQTYARPSQTAASPVGNGADCPMPRTNSRRRLVASLLRPRADVANAPPDVNCAVAWCERTRIQAECTERGRRSCDRNTFSLLVRMQKPCERSPRGSNCANETARPRRAESSSFSVTLRSTSSVARVLRTESFLLRNLSQRCGVRGGSRRHTPADRSGAISTCFSCGTPTRRT